ncbi:restriction endonuclease subunit S [Mesomycoplasma hyorhinis]|uniref:restriction endonuclease subunit S n=1 Tax=Mesomycoplasma hyorhinis TaxID=2100 RepID=UPI001C051C8E|nr:restriction endonuclease subunit S [Mesomycoplasma hyorhinis]
MFELDGGGFVSKKEILENPGKYPVYSSQTTNNGTMGYISTYRYDLECLTWTTRGYVGVVFYRNEKFNVSNSGLLTFKNNFKYDYKYFAFVFQNSNIQSLITAGSIPQFTVEMMKDVVLNYSTNIFEQQKIASLFYTLDKIVSLYERKISLFEKLQKYFLQNMFVKEKEGKPNVRFNKFDTLWTQKNIEDNFIIDGGGFVSKQEIKNNPGQYPVYSSQTSNNGKMGSINYYKYDGEFITWTTRGALAGSIFYRNEKFNVSNAGLLQAKDNQLSDVKFYYYVLKNSNLRTIMTIGSIPQFTVQMIKNINCLIPDNKDEQEQISNFLTHIDITHAQLKRKLNLIKNIQKSLLNKMFV